MNERSITEQAREKAQDAFYDALDAIDDGKSVQDFETAIRKRNTALWRLRNHDSKPFEGEYQQHKPRW